MHGETLLYIISILASTGIFSMVLGVAIEWMNSREYKQLLDLMKLHLISTANKRAIDEISVNYKKD